MNNHFENLELFIQKVDSNGDGVSFDQGFVFLIKHTIKEDIIKIKTFEKIKKNIIRVNDFEFIKKSTFHIKPNCPYYLNCNGCQYLHMNYEEELNTKRTNHEYLSKSFLKNYSFTPKIEMHSTNQRYSYRNRIQLHFNLMQNQLGMMKKASHEILNIENCLMADEKIQNYLIDNKAQIINKIEQEKHIKGHIELSILEKEDKKVLLEINKPYAFHGFSQVNPLANKIILEIIHKAIEELKKKKSLNSFIELFSGNGNLTRSFTGKFKQSYHLDSYDFSSFYKEEKHEFLKLNLFSKKALIDFKRIKKPNLKYIDLLILDPPRSGMQDLNLWINEYNPSVIIYISCWPSSMLRDIQNLAENYIIKESHLVDMFPGTSHYESVIILLKK